MNLIAKPNKLPLEFIVKAVTIGFSLGLGVICLLIIVLTVFMGLFINPSEMPSQFDAMLSLLSVVLILQGFAFSLITALGLGVYMKFKKISVEIN